MFLLIVVLVPLGIMLRLIGGVYYLQGVAMTTLMIALILLYSAAFQMIAVPQFEKHYTSYNFAGVPYFFGVVCFAFEGNCHTIENYVKMKEKKDFPKAIGLAIALVTALYQFTGIFLYQAFAQFTQPKLLESLNPNFQTTWIIKVLYAIGMSAGFMQHFVPLFSIFDGIELAEDKTDSLYKSYLFRVIIAMFIAVAGYKVRDFGTYINL